MRGHPVATDGRRDGLLQRQEPGMSVEELLREGRGQEALTELQARVRKAPADGKLRTLLFQLLALQGQWSRAVAQLQVIGQLDVEALPMVQTYREALRCELLRAEVFAGRRAPLVFGEPMPWLALLIEALSRESSDPAGAQALRQQAFELAPITPGSADGQRFAWVADSDGRLGPVLEAIVNGNYYWIPFERLSAIRQEAPADLRDFVWMPAMLTFANGGESVALIPSRYPGSEGAEAALQFARRTEWSETAAGLLLGRGQRVFATDVADVALFDLRELLLDAPAADAVAD